MNEEFHDEEFLTRKRGRGKLGISVTKWAFLFQKSGIFYILFHLIACITFLFFFLVKNAPQVSSNFPCSPTKTKCVCLLPFIFFLFFEKNSGLVFFEFFKRKIHIYGFFEKFPENRPKFGIFFIFYSHFGDFILNFLTLYHY